jgi:hypothetical protein
MPGINACQQRNLFFEGHLIYQSLNPLFQGYFLFWAANIAGMLPIIYVYPSEMEIAYLTRLAA